MSKTRRSVDEKINTRRSSSYKTGAVNKTLINLIKQYEQKLKGLKILREKHGKIAKKKKTLRLSNENPQKNEPNAKMLSNSLQHDLSGLDITQHSDRPKDQSRYSKQTKISHKPISAFSSIDYPDDSFITDAKSTDVHQNNTNKPKIPLIKLVESPDKLKNRLLELSEHRKDLQKNCKNSFFLTFSDKNEQTEEAFYEILTDRERLFNQKLEELSSEYESKKRGLELQISTLRKENEKLSSVLSSYKADNEVKAQSSGSKISSATLCSKCKAYTNINSDLQAKIDRLNLYLK